LKNLLVSAKTYSAATSSATIRGVAYKGHLRKMKERTPNLVGQYTKRWLTATTATSGVRDITFSKHPVHK